MRMEAIADARQPEIIHGHYPLALKLAFKRDFIHGKGTAEALAHKHRVSYHTARQWVADGKWTKTRALWLKKQEMMDETAVAVPAPETPEQVAKQTLSDRVKIIESRIREGEESLANAADAKEFQALCIGLEKLYSIWSLLTGHERPGVRRPQRSKRSMPSMQGLPQPDTDSQDQ